MATSLGVQGLESLIASHCKDNCYSFQIHTNVCISITDVGNQLWVEVGPVDKACFQRRDGQLIEVFDGELDHHVLRLDVRVDDAVAMDILQGKQYLKCTKSKTKKK